jgi:glycogen debranching enzyme
LSEEPPRLLPEVVGGAVCDVAGRALELATSGETEPLVLARGNLFCVTNRRGDIAPAGARDLGLFCDDTRHLSYLELFVAGGPPLVLSADTAGAFASQIDLTLTDSHFGGFLADPQNFLHIRRKQLLDDALVEQIVLTNHLRRPVDLWLELRMAADFADVFEVRGARRKRRGTLKSPQYAGDRLLFSYLGLDGELYRTTVRLSPEPRRLGPTGPFYELKLLPGEATMLQIVVEPGRGDATPRWGTRSADEPYDRRLVRASAEHRAFLERCARVQGNNILFNDMVRRSLEDIAALRLSIDGRAMIGAGIPWFAAPFGRDAIITALELLSVTPELARETLLALAHHQGRTDDPWREEEPGKIMHELRRGELARAGEVPHSPYYGTVDATPLWLVLLGETWRWLGDRALLERLMPTAEAALAWIRRRLDAGGGFVRYMRTHERGLENQGWKDSRDGVSFPDGTIAAPPIALVEVQGYVVGALEAMATIVRALGDPARAEALEADAARLRAAIHDAFWVGETGFYALALDGNDRRVPTLTSNPGHLLFTRAVAPPFAARVIEVLMSDEMFSGFGVRTLGRGQAVYNPLSYHNGSVWPHDNALIALGATRYGHDEAALRIVEGMYHASLHFRRHRLPELFCGMGRGEGDFLVHYPVSCSPQAWASASMVLFLQAVLGLHPDAPRQTLTISNPRLPQFLDRLELHRVRVGQSLVTLRFERHPSDDDRTHTSVVRCEGAPLRVKIELG